MLTRARALGRMCSLLLLASHPAPALAVTIVVSTLAWRTGWESASLAMFVLAMLTGQLSVGWSNDAHDARMDRAAARLDKPVVASELSVHLLWRCAVTALTISVIASFAAAGVAGGFHVLSLLAAWAYNLRLSRTVWSWLPYAIAFGLIPPFITEGLDPAQAPAPWSIVVFISLGVAAHLANAAKDASTDAAYGHTSAAIKLGEQGSKLLALALLLLGTAVLVWQLWDANPPVAATTAVISIAISAIGYFRSSLFFQAILILALADIALLLLTDLSIVS